MSTKSPAGLERLARANPVAVDTDRGRRPDAQVVLARILASERPATRVVTRRRSHRTLMIALAAAVLIGGAALAATDPFGFWRSSNPGAAMYGVDGSHSVRTPTAAEIGCRRSSAAIFTCAAQLPGQRYTLTDVIEAPAALTRSKRRGALASAARSGHISRQAKRRFEADLAAVPDSFLAHLSEALHFGTIGAGGALVPPPGVPEWLACAQDGMIISCRDLNGDERVAIGSGVYAALPARDWVRGPRATAEPPYRTTAQMIKTIFGGWLTAAENRLLLDVATTASTTQSSSSRPTRATPGH
jgi:hypothetical protein